MAHRGDIRQAQSLLRWIARLGKNNCDILLCVDRDTPLDEVMACQKVALESFTDCHITTNAVATKGHKEGSYSLFKAACEAVARRYGPFILLEPDSVPLQKDWFERLKEAYYAQPKPYLGFMYEGTQNFVGEKFMSGIAVYSPATYARLTWDQPVYWDVHHRKEFTENGTHTDLIYHFFGGMDGGVRFIADLREPQSPREKHLSWIPEGCVLFHRDKLQSLLPILRKKLFNESGKLIDVVFPVHSGDIAQALHHSHWLRKLHTTKSQHRAVVSFDRATPINEVALLTNILRECFSEVEQFTYVHPPIPGYPAGANWAWQNTALHMMKRGHPWLWLEADCVVLRSNWLDQLQLQYESDGRDFMGVIVPHMTHLQGTSVYPADTPKRLHGSMRAVHEAFDMLSKEHIGDNVSDASNLMFHMWTVFPDGRPCPVGGGELPVNITAAWVRQHVPKSCVFAHRIKSNHLVQELLNGAQI